MEVLTQPEQLAVTELETPQEAPGEEKVLIREITLRNILSFGPEAEPIQLRGLNVLIGPNGSGKSNLIEAIALLRAAPNEMANVTRRGGGVAEWIWKGNPNGIAHLDAVIDNWRPHELIRHTVEFENGPQFVLTNEFVEVENGGADFYYRYQNYRPVLKGEGKDEISLASASFAFGRSILTQMRDPISYPELTQLSYVYEDIRIYREWTFGHKAVFRAPQQADQRNDWLAEDFSNLGLFLNKLRRNPTAKRAILSALADLYEGFTDFDVSIEGGAVQVFFTEGDFTIPATRLSDGTLRYLCLLAILCDPNPPPLICIEEPELGLHPDILPDLAKLLIDASQRTQLIVTTHSNILVDAMTERPEAILICEKHEGQTRIRRLGSAEMEGWLENYRLGELWSSGQLGGVRW